MRYEIIDYDVWGNDEEGFWVNQAFHTGRHVEIPDGASNEQIVHALKEAGEIKDSIKPRDVEIEGEEGYTLYIGHAPTGRPEFELQASELMHVVGYLRRNVLTHPRTGAGTGWRVHHVVRHYRLSSSDTADAVVLVKRMRSGDKFAGAYALGDGMLLRGEVLDERPVDEDRNWREWLRLRDEAGRIAVSESEYWAERDAETDAEADDERDQ